MFRGVIQNLSGAQVGTYVEWTAIDELAFGVSQRAAPVADPKSIAQFYAASALVGGVGAVGSMALTGGTLTNLAIGTAPLLPIAPSALGKLQRLGVSLQQAAQIVSNPASQRLIDVAYGNNINVIQQVGDKLVRITLDPTGQRIISAGYVQGRNVVNGIASGRFIPK